MNSVISHNVVATDYLTVCLFLKIGFVKKQSAIMMPKTKRKCIDELILRVYHYLNGKDKRTMLKVFSFLVPDTVFIRLLKPQVATTHYESM